MNRPRLEKKRRGSPKPERQRTTIKRKSGAGKHVQDTGAINKASRRLNSKETPKAKKKIREANTPEAGRDKHQSTPLPIHRKQTTQETPPHSGA